MQVIGISGLAQCGKTTLADEIAKVAYERNMRPVRMSFAGSLKQAASVIGAAKDKQPDLYRRFCQEVGANCRNPDYVPGVTGPNWWVDRTRENLTDLGHEYEELFLAGKGSEPVFIFDDVRFQNELDMLRCWGGCTLIYVDREHELPDAAGEWRRHDSEAMAYEMRLDHERRMRNYNVTVCSTGSMDEYLTRVRPYIPVWLGLETLGFQLPEKN